MVSLLEGYGWLRLNDLCQLRISLVLNIYLQSSVNESFIINKMNVSINLHDCGTM